MGFDTSDQAQIITLINSVINAGIQAQLAATAAQSYTYQASKSNCTSASVHTTTVQLLAANSNRKWCVIFNGSDAGQDYILVQLGSTAAPTAFTYFLPYRTGVTITNWTGAISACTAASGGTCGVYITELS